MLLKISSLKMLSYAADTWQSFLYVWFKFSIHLKKKLKDQCHSDLICFKIYFGNKVVSYYTYKDISTKAHLHKNNSPRCNQNL